MGRRSVPTALPGWYKVTLGKIKKQLQRGEKILSTTLKFSVKLRQ